MKYCYIIFLILSIFLSTCNPSHASEDIQEFLESLKDSPDPVKEVEQKVVELFIDKKYSAAAELIEKSLKVAKMKRSKIGRIMKAIGWHLYLERKYDEAEAVLLRGVNVLKKEKNSNRYLIASSLNIIGLIYIKQLKYDKAEETFNRTQKIFENLLGYEKEDVAVTLEHKALLEEAKANFSKAEKLRKKALDIRKKIFRSNHIEMSVPLRDLAKNYRQQKRYSEAEPLLNESLLILENELDVLGHNIHISGKLQIEMAYLFMERGELDYEQKERDKAASNFYQAKDLFDIHGRKYEKSLVIEKISRIYEDSSNYEKSQELLKEALALRKHELGENHPEVQRLQNKIAGKPFH